MFGEYGVYANGKLFGLICDPTLFVKITEAGSTFAGRISQDSPYPGAKPALRISSSKLNNNKWLTRLVEVTILGIPVPKKRNAKSLRLAGRGLKFRPANEQWSSNFWTQGVRLSIIRTTRKINL